MTVTEKISVSVIVPVYNAQDFIFGFLKSIRKQTLKNIEIICVDDGSTDRTGKIIKGFAKLDRRITCVYEENRGAGCARNKGIELATGEYLIFLDADDLYDKDMLRRLYKKAETFSADIAVCSAEKTDYLLKDVKKLSSFNVDEDISEDRVYTFGDFKNGFTAFDVSPQNKLFKADFVRENKISFSAVKSSNDLFFTEKARVLSRGTVFIKEDLVKIRRHYNKSSISTTRKKSADCILTVLTELYDFLSEQGLSREVLEKYVVLCGRHIKYGAQQEENDGFVSAVSEFLKKEPWTELSPREIFYAMGYCAFCDEEEIKSLEKAKSDGDKAKKAFAENRKSNMEKILSQIVPDENERCIYEGELLKGEYSKIFRELCVNRERNKKLKENFLVRIGLRLYKIVAKTGID